MLESGARLLGDIQPFRLEGRLVGVSGLAAELAGLSPLLSIGDRVTLAGRGEHRTEAEIVGFHSGRAKAMAFTSLDGLGPGSPVQAATRRPGLPGDPIQSSGFPGDPNQSSGVSGDPLQRPGSPGDPTGRPAARRGDDRGDADRRQGDRSGGARGGGAVRAGTLAVDDRWLGRVIDPLGQPLDGGAALPQGRHARPVRGRPPAATMRARLGPRLATGVRVIDGFATCRQGQRLGLFAGSGVGKSILLSMLARRTACDVVVLALVGERGREVREFLEDDLKADGLARAVVVVATSDSLPLMRREAGYAAMTVAEHFRDQGRSVLLLMDSVTRFCLALREIGLSAGEPPATRGYPPSVFAELPRLLERAGPGAQPPDGAAPGMITALFTVLVEGDDHNEPVADAVRSILDGHVVLDRRIAEGGRYPAMDVLRSLSRAVPGCLEAEEYALTRRARAILALHGDMADLVRLGAYRAGTDPAVDEAILLAPRIEEMLRQERDEPPDRPPAFAMLREALAPPAPPPPTPSDKAGKPEKDPPPGRLGRLEARRGG